MLFGLLLVALGMGTYLISESRSLTALIPAGFGVVIAILGALALNESYRKHAMHLASLLGLIGCATPLFMSVRKLMDGAALDLALQSQLAMAGICGIFLALCVNSFIQARRARQQAEKNP